MWFPYANEKSPDTSEMNVICLHHAGGNAGVFRNILKNLPVNVYALELPGRGMRIGETPYNDIRKAADDVVLEIENLVLQSPYVMVAHSMGTWLCLCLLLRLSEKGMPLPDKIFFSCFPSPTIEKRPWHPNAPLTEREFQQELTMWGVDQRVFRPTIWESFRSLLRSDFSLFDEFYLTNDEIKLLIHLKRIPFVGFYAEYDERVSKVAVESWRDVFPSSEFVKLKDAKHLFIQNDKQSKAVWMNVIEQMVSASIDEQIRSSIPV